ncbi:MAG TPA: serine hydrolase domain-containing protein [Chitinophagaceae bacterium]|nr:serine hydrolase domain-containing protein [Chitinophagaceae bacterium]
MKTIAYLVIAILIPFSCNQSAESRGTRSDSLEFYPPTPGAMNTDEFRYYYRQLSRYFDSTLLRRGFNGAILVAKDGNILYEKYHGLADLRGRDSIHEYTSFHIASATKPFTGVAILRLVQQNQLSLDEPLETFFPGFPYSGVTVRMLLNHRSGIPNYMYFAEKSWDKKRFMQNQDVLDLLYRLKPKRTSQPGQAFNYSNTNFVLLALIVEKLSGMSFADYLRQNFFEPLGMQSTYLFSLADTLTATPSFTHGGTHWKNDFLEATYGDKNIYSTPRDLLKWDQALYTENVLSHAWLDSAFTPYDTRRPVHKYGLGWRLLVFPNGKKIVYHFGRWHGFNAAFARLVDEKVTIIILGNKFTRSVYNSAHDAYKLFGNYGAESEEENGAGSR